MCEVREKQNKTQMNNQFLDGVEELWDDKNVMILFGTLSSHSESRRNTSINFWSAQIVRRRDIVSGGVGPAEGNTNISAFQFSFESLQRDFRYRGLVPMCLSSVIVELEKRGQLLLVQPLGTKPQTLQEYQKQQQQQQQSGWLSWTFNTFVINP